MKSERWVWLAAAVLALGFWGWRAVAAPLPFYSFQSDPELRYYYNSLLLANGQLVEHTDHPGTALQLTGAVIARGLGLGLKSAFDPAALGRFMLSWRIVALASLLGTGAWLARRLRGRGSWVVALLVLLAAFDYQTLVYWLTFTPESAFFVLYFPAALVCLFRARDSGGCAAREGVLRSALLGFITTIKLTLWPVTLFVLAQLALAAGPEAPARAWRRLAGFTGVAFLTYAGVATVFAQHPAAPWRWVLALIEHSGRYGTVRAGGGVFPPWSVGLEALQRAFALQNYTTLPVFGGAVLLAAWAWRQRSPAAHTRLLGGSFLAALLLLFAMFLKHPYQGKYLMPASLLVMLYTVTQAGTGMLPPLRWLRPLCLVLGLIVVNAVLCQKLLYDYTIPRDERICAHIDAWLARAPHDALIFSSRLAHPIPAFRESAPPPLLPFFTARFGRMEPTGTYSLDFQRVAAAELPAVPGARHPIAFLNTPTADPRWRLVEAVPADELYVYFPK